jgi:hypothetical protein
MLFDAAAVAARMTSGGDLVDPSFPRDLAATAPLTMPVSIITCSNLTTAVVGQTLRAATGRKSSDLSPRALRGFLVAHRGFGMIFLDEDEVASMRLALAHELAHFVGHYLVRRELAIARLGSDILDVLDGARAATAQERLSAIFLGCPLGVFTDVMERDGGVPLNALAEVMEYEADEAAFLALAPVEAVVAHATRREGRVERGGVVSTLIEVFGLSASDADRHAPRIINAVDRRMPSFIDRLREAASKIDSDRHI